MNKEQVKNALGRCLNCRCNGCSYQGIRLCVDVIAKDALILITEQEEAIEWLQKKLADVLVCVKDTDDNIDVKRLQKQAVKEFTEKVKEKAYTNNYCQEVVLKDTIDELLKEYEK